MKGTKADIHYEQTTNVLGAPRDPAPVAGAIRRVKANRAGSLQASWPA
jgi:hypothetical protein